MKSRMRLQENENKMLSIWYLIQAVCLVSLAASSKIDCGKEKFPCDSGNQCVQRNKWCDKHPDCDDKSDEAYCKKIGWFSASDPNGCSSREDTHIFCGSGICIPLVAGCDGYKDCDDGYDEKYCDEIENETESSSSVKPTETESSSSVKPTETESSSSVKPTETLNEYDFSSKEKSTISTTSESRTFPLKLETTNDFREDKQKLRTTTSTTRPAFSSGVTDYYDMRMKEASLENKPKIPPSSFPKSIPTRPYLTTRSLFLSTQKIPSTKPSTPTTPRSVSSGGHSIGGSRSQIAFKPRTIDQQRQTAPQRTNQYQSPINHYQLPTYHYQPQTNYLNPPSRHQPPFNNYQDPSYSYQSSSNHYHRPINPYQPHRLPIHTNYDEQRPQSRQPDIPHQTNYFKPYGTQLEIRRPFYFAKDYSTLYSRNNERSLRDGVQWLLGQRSDSGDWGKDTARAVVSLALSSNDSFFDGNNEYEIIKRRFMVQLGTDIMKNNTKGFNINRMFMAINGLLAVCEDPTDFHGMDLTELLIHKMRENSSRNKSYQNPFVSLSLCLSNKSLNSSEVHKLMNRMQPSGNMNERTKDAMVSAILAFSCYIHQSSSENTNYRISLRNKLREAITELVNHGSEDGSFGSVYSTALAAQALMSTNESNDWNAEKTISFLKQQQRHDGSFGDFLATYWVLPVLNGKSLLHLRNMNCTPVKRELTPKEILEFTGPKQYVNYFLHFGYPVVNSQSLSLVVPQGIRFLDVMRVAEYQDPNFRFSLESNSSKVYSLSGLPNDPEMGLSWHLYVKQGSSPYLTEPNSIDRLDGDLRSISPKQGETFLFWYHSDTIQL